MVGSSVHYTTLPQILLKDYLILRVLRAARSQIKGGSITSMCKVSKNVEYAATPKILRGKAVTTAAKLSKRHNLSIDSSCQGQRPWRDDLKGANLSRTHLP